MGRNLLQHMAFATALTLLGCDASAPAPALEGSEVVAAPPPAPVVPPEAAADAELAARVRMQFAASPDVDARRVLVEVADGVVTLRAAAGATDDDVARASRVASVVPGVASVVPPPAGGGPAPKWIDVVAASEDAIRIARRREVEPVLRSASDGSGSGAAARAASGDRPRTYRVRSGDSLSVIASRTMGDGKAWRRIYEMNRHIIGPDPERLAAGMELRIPQD